MAMIVNKMIRVIPKKQHIRDVDCHAIGLKLVETGGELWNKVIYHINKEENCLDIKYKSRKGRGILGIEDQSEAFDIWIIENFEGGSDYIRLLNSQKHEIHFTKETINLYCFDEIRLKGNHQKLKEDFYPNFFLFQNNKPKAYLEKVLRQEKDGFISFQVDGIYNAGTIYDVGNEYSSISELVSKLDFFKPRQVHYWEADFLITHQAENYGIKKLILAAVKDEFSSIKWDNTNLKEIQFCFKQRIVKKIELGTHWKYYNAEFFDNTIERNWLDYCSLWRRSLI